MAKTNDRETMSEQKEPEKWNCLECEKEYKTKGNATKHAKETNHLNFEKVY